MAGGIEVVLEAVVESVGATLPKFDGLWGEAVASPVGGAGYGLVFVFCLQFCEFGFEDLA